MTRPFREITRADVGHFLFEAFGRKYCVRDFMGRVMPGDVGKRVYKVGDILQVENDEQRATRLAKTEDLAMDEREAGVDFDTMFTLVTLSVQGYATEILYGRRNDAEVLLDQKADAKGVIAIYLYGPAGHLNTYTAP